jgi:hypothetical protein
MVRIGPGLVMALVSVEILFTGANIDRTHVVMFWREIRRDKRTNTGTDNGDNLNLSRYHTDSVKYIVFPPGD